ncbi:DUF6046 domain-containing protein [Flavobacterium suncheonense]|uniref:DUF6046 domain-containing protein n=1 Tax=Flavobacterium suncheonense TaxID=350894 RepID=UPI000421F3C9|nr:DUF6046 domain-containing protein [Flavobacterium suncheonense]
MLDNTDILFASLMGANKVGEIQRLNLVQNELSKRVLPAIPFLPVKNETVIAQAKYDQSFNPWMASAPISEEQQFFPLSFSFTENGEKWTFPFEPMLSISSGNNVVERNVAKQDNMIGTVKERWSQKDFEISITGALIGSMMKGQPQDCYPVEMMSRLFEFLKHRKEIFVYSFPLETLGITKVVIYDYSFPFTKGENVQAYDIKVKSDFAYNLLVKEEDIK